MGFRKPGVHLIAVVAAASLGTTLGGVKAREASPAQSADQMMAGMMHDAEGGNGADLGPGLFAAADRTIDGARHARRVQGRVRAVVLGRRRGNQTPPPRRSCWMG